MNKKEKTITKRLVLLDAHAILHRAYHALPGFSTTDGHPTGALYGLATMLIKLAGDLRPDYLVACYDLPEPTHRHDVYEAYKAGRVAADQELIEQIKSSRDIFEAFGIPAYESKGFEADDPLGTIVQELAGRADLEIIIASGDMDTLQLVDNARVRVYTMKKGIQDTMLYDEAAVTERFGFRPEYLPDFKGLSGDKSDNIPGIQGIGEKTATTLIQSFGHIEDIYRTLQTNRQALGDAGIKERIITLLEENEDEALFSKMLATIRTDAPIEFALPEKPWRESFDKLSAQRIFKRFEFRNLGPRLAQALGQGDDEEEEQNKQADNPESVPEDKLVETEIALWLVKSNITNPTKEDVLSFANTDSFAAAQEEIFKELERRGLSNVFEEIEKPLIPIVAAMNERGIMVDRPYLEKLSKKYHTTLDEIEKTIYKEAGHEFNVNSPKQLGEVLFDELGLSIKNHKKTSTGARSTRESELLKLEGEHPIIDLILQHRELSKLLSSYIDALPPMLDEGSRLHAEFLQAGTTTGRMASQHPNLQNIPIRTELGRNIRNAFVASEGYQLISFDYSQIELRVAAILSQDPKLINAFANNADIHQAVASEVFGVAPEKVDKEMRRKAKVINFGILYGMGVNALQQNLGTDRKEAQQFYNNYFDTFSVLAEYLEKVKDSASRQGYTETLFGRRRYFEGINSHLPQIRSSAERMAINAPVQGTAADILKIAMKEINEQLKARRDSKRAYLLLQVHDELIYEVPHGAAEDIIPMIKKTMESVLDHGKARGVPLLVEAEAGENWGSLTPLA